MIHVPLIMVICTTGAQYDSCPLGNGDMYYRGSV